MNKTVEMPQLKSQLEGSALFTKKDRLTDKAVRKHTDIQTGEELERATFYLYPTQQPALEELKLNLRKKGIKTDKSELTRIAIDLLTTSSMEEVTKRLTKR